MVKKGDVSDWMVLCHSIIGLSVDARLTILKLTESVRGVPSVCL